MTRFNHPKAVALAVSALFGFGAAACGSADKVNRSTLSTTPVSSLGSLTGDYDNDDYTVAHSGDGDSDDNHRPKDRDNDIDNKSGSYYDADDNVVRRYGHAADAIDEHAITALVKRYFATAVAHDGAAGCSMILSTVARSIPEDIGRPPGPPYLRGNTCAAVVSKVFNVNHKQLGAYAAALRITGVRVDHDHGVAVLGFRMLPGREIRVERQGGAWKIEGLLDRELP
jgi:hypothetical protein